MRPPLILALVAAALLAGCGGGDGSGSSTPSADLAVPWVDPDGLAPYIGSLSVNPGDGSLIMGTNTGLFEIPKAGGKPEKVTGRLTVDYLGGLPVIAARAPHPRGIQFAIKYAVDRLLATVLLLLASPLMIAAALGVLFTLGRPIFFRQRRVGRDGREFEMLKFRSMRPVSWDGDEEQLHLPPDTAPGGVEGADRRTALGSFLRRTSIDELPQLLNVLMGDMSLIGPRPERPQFVGLFEQSVYRYSDRHRVKSGITGWAQVHGLRGKTSLSDRVEWDNYYIENWSLWLDLKVLLLTFLAVTRSPQHVE